jgi:hypothetical protein
MPLPGIIRIIVRDNVDVSGEIILTGTDVTGSPLQETITFSYDHTNPNGYPPSSGMLLEDDPSQFGKLRSTDTGATLVPEMKRATRLITTAQCPCRYSANVFGSVSSIRLENLVGGSISGTITVQALLDTRGLLQLAEVVEREGVVESLVDNRKIMAGLSLPDRGIHAALSFADVDINDIHNFRYIENFSEPKLGDFRLTNVEDPLQSSYDNFATPSRQGDSMFYISRLLPLMHPNATIPSIIDGTFTIFSRLSGRFMARLDFVSYTTGSPVIVSTSIFNELGAPVRRNVLSLNLAPNSAEAVLVTIRGTGLDGFVLSMSPSFPG